MSCAWSTSAACTRASARWRCCAASTCQVARGRGHRHPRPVRLRQVHPAAHHQPPGEGRPRLISVDGELVGYRRSGNKLHELRERDDPAAAHPDRLRLPELQPLPAPHRAGERRRGAGLRAAPARARRSRRPAAPAAGPGRARRQGGRLPAAALRRAAAAGRHRPGARPATQGRALRRTDLGARPRAGRRGPRRHQGPGQQRHHDDRRHPRDRLRPRGRRHRRLHGRRPDRRAGSPRPGARQPPARAHPPVSPRFSDPRARSDMSFLSTLVPVAVALPLLLASACGASETHGGGADERIRGRAARDRCEDQHEPRPEPGPRATRSTPSPPRCPRRSARR